MQKYTKYESLTTFLSYCWQRSWGYHNFSIFPEINNFDYFWNMKQESQEGLMLRWILHSFLYFLCPLTLDSRPSADIYTIFVIFFEKHIKTKSLIISKSKALVLPVVGRSYFTRFKGFCLVSKNFRRIITTILFIR